MLENVKKEKEIVKSLNSMNMGRKEEYLEKLKALRDNIREMAKDEVALVYKRCFLFNNPDNNEKMKQDIDVLKNKKKDGKTINWKKYLKN